MKKWCLFLSVYLCLCILAACGAAGGGSPAPGGTPSAEPQTGGETARPASVTTTCRVVTAEDGQLLLAGQGNDSNIYSLFWEGASIRPSALVEIIYDGTVQETYPAQFSGVSAAAPKTVASTTCAPCTCGCWRTCGPWTRG